MELNDLLKKSDIPAENVLVLRHRPHEPELRKILPWLASERPEIFNAYQQTQSKPLENAMTKITDYGYLASFIGHTPGKAVFVGLYKIKNFYSLSYEDFWKIPEHIEMKSYGMQGFQSDNLNSTTTKFDLEKIDFYPEWSGKLIINWNSERSWWRRAHRNQLFIDCIHEESILTEHLPSWQSINLNWQQLKILPASWRMALSHWRGIYYIFDTTDSKGYVGSAYGEENIFGRWINYATTGHGNNKLLKKREPSNFHFSILERVSPDLSTSEITNLERSWKQRLNTLSPYGLNDN